MIMNDKQRLKINLVKLFDLILIVFSFALTTVFIVKTEYAISLIRFLSMRTRVVNFGIAVLALLICHIIFNVCGLYRSRRLSRRRTEMIDVLKATTLSVACFVVLSSVFSIRMITIHFLAIFWVQTTFILAASRLTIKPVVSVGNDGEKSRPARSCAFMV